MGAGIDARLAVQRQTEVRVGSIQAWSAQARSVTGIKYRNGNRNTGRTADQTAITYASLDSVLFLFLVGLLDWVYREGLKCRVCGWTKGQRKG